MMLSARHRILEDFRPVITADLQEKDACLVAVSGDGTISITDLRKMKVGSRKPYRGILHPQKKVSEAGGPTDSCQLPWPIDPHWQHPIICRRIPRHVPTLMSVPGLCGL